MGKKYIMFKILKDYLVFKNVIMSLIIDKNFETIKVPVSYKKVFLKLVNNYSVKEIEEKFVNDIENDDLFFSSEQEKELVSLKSYWNLKNTINKKFSWK